MIRLTKKHLIIIASLIWYTGSISLVLKSISLLNDAYNIYPNLPIIIISAIAGLTIGFFKGKYIFAKFCRKNIKRINELQKIKPWLFFKPSFIIALAIMISSGVALSKWAEGMYAPLITVAILDLTIGTALFYSSFVHWEKRQVMN